ncbi:FHA domain-containing protein [bacterium]|nr:FHA domain-containing protein [bacterium]
MVPRSKRPSAPLEDETARLSIGRSSENDVAVDDRSVSRRHASLVRRRGARWSVIDEGSSNGTFLDGSRLSPGVPMEVATSIAILRCGDASFSILRQAPFAQLLEAIASRPTNTRGDTSKIVYPEGVAGMRRTLPANARLSHVAETVLGRLKSTSIAARSYRVTLEGALVEDLVGLPRLLAFAEEQAARIVTIEAALGKGGTFLLYERPEEPLIA